MALLAALFVLALGVGYAASSSGGEQEPVRPVGSAAVPIAVPDADGGATASADPAASGLGETPALPRMARNPKPPPRKPDPPPETFTEEPVVPDPVVPEPAPTPVAPPAPQPTPPPVEFDDEG